MESPTRILVVDDDPTVLHATVRALQRAGYVVDQAGTGSAALAALGSFRPHLVLLDRVLPDADGLEVCRAIKADRLTARTLVVVVSGVKTHTEDMADGLGVGADGYLSRPLGNRELLGRVESILRLANPSGSLRERAEAIVRERRRQATPDSATELQQVLYQLEVHQVEIEMQNEELQSSHRRLEEARDRYFQLYHNAPAGYATLDREGVLGTVNQTLASLLGRDVATLEGSSLVEHLMEEDRALFVEHWPRFRAASSDHSMRLRVVHAGGGPIDVLLSAAPAGPSEDGVPPAGRGADVQVSVTDVSAQVKAEAAAASLREQLTHAQKMESIGRLAGGVAHDFNNLLTAITLNVSLATESLRASDDLQVPLDEIARAADSAAALTRQLLTFSRRQVVEPRVLDLNEELRRTQRMLARIIGEHIRVDLRTDAPHATVEMDPAQLQQILVNLAVNSRDAMPHGGHLTLGTCAWTPDPGAAALPPDLEPGPHVLLTVRDTGAGMSAHVLTHLFEPFFTTKGRAEGTGLGLAMVYGAVKQNRGHIEVTSAPNAGAEFRIYLPLVERSSPGPGARPLTEPLAGTETILLAEDEPMVRRVATRVLERAGYRVLACADAAEALEVAAQTSEPIALLLTDVVMPGDSGKVLADRLAVVRPETKVLFTSGYNEEITHAEGGLAEGVAFLPKPYSPTSLLARVREVLDA